MAKARKKVSAQLKRLLVKEAGGKCANPGCSNRRTELHHIRQWHVWQTHDRMHMVALCPACHDAAHNGTLRIQDDELYRWKAINRQPSPPIRDHFYVEPGAPTSLRLGTVMVVSLVDRQVFDLSPANRLGFRVVGGDIVRLDLTITTLAGQEVLQVVDGDVKHIVQDDITYNSRRGRIVVTAPDSPGFLPPWLPGHLMSAGTQLVLADNRDLILLDMQVTGPGTVSVLGLWASESRAVAVTKNGVYFVAPAGLVEAFSAVTLTTSAPVTGAVFGIPDWNK